MDPPNRDICQICLEAETKGRAGCTCIVRHGCSHGIKGVIVRRDVGMAMSVSPIVSNCLEWMGA